MKNVWLRSSAIALFLIFFLAFLLRLPYFSQPLDYDESYMAFSGFYSKGGSFYPSLESFPTSGRLPGIILIYRFLDDLFPQNFTFIRLASTLFTLLAVYGIYQIGKIRGHYKEGLWAAAILAIFISQISTPSPANAEFFMMPLVVMSYYFFLLFRKGEKKTLLVVSGFLAGTAILIKQAAIFEIFLLGVWLLIITVKKIRKEFLKSSVVTARDCLKILFPVLIFVLSLLAPLVVTAVVFWAKGQLQDLWLQGFGAGKSYMASAWKGNDWQFRLMQLYRVFRSKFIFFFLAGLGGAWMIIKKKEAELGFVFLWFFFALFEAVFTGYFFDHYFVSVIPPLSLFGGVLLFNITGYLKSKYLKIIFIVFAVTIMIKNSFSSSLSYYKWRVGLIDQKKHWQNIGQEIGDQGWVPFLDSADYLKKIMKEKETLFVWSSTPVSYYLVGRRSTVDFYQNFSALGDEFSLSTYKGFKLNFASNREKLMQKLIIQPPTYILFHVNPEQVFDQLFLFKDLSNFLSFNYDFNKKFGNILIFRLKDQLPVNLEKSSDVSIPLELVKRFAAIVNVETKEKQKIVIFEPMINFRGTLHSYKTFYPTDPEIDFYPLTLKTVEFGKEDLVGFADFKPSGTTDLHLKVVGYSKTPSFVRVKIGNFFWCNSSYGVNSIIKVQRSGEEFDLYFEPVLFKKNDFLEIYFIYEDGMLAYTKAIIE